MKISGFCVFTQPRAEAADHIKSITPNSLGDFECFGIDLDQWPALHAGFELKWLVGFEWDAKTARFHHFWLISDPFF